MGEQSVYITLRDWIVALLRDDDELHDLLFPSTKPSVGPADARIYEWAPELPPELRDVWPRILIELVTGPDPYEQPSNSCAVTVTLHSIAEKYDGDRALLLDDRAIDLLTSTAPVTSRMIGPMAVVAAESRRLRERMLNDAAHVVSTVHYTNVGVLA